MLVIGVGNELRGDDGLGVFVVRRLREAALPAGVELVEAQGETVGLIDVWEGAEAVVLVDATRSGGPVATVRRFEASRSPLPTPWRSSSSTHAIALDQAIELGRALGRLPREVIVFAVEGRSFDTGARLSDEIESAVDGVAEAALAEVRRLAGG